MVSHRSLPNLNECNIGRISLSLNSLKQYDSHMCTRRKYQAELINILPESPHNSSNRIDFVYVGFLTNPIHCVTPVEEGTAWFGISLEL
jgi:hypothetical protein